MARSRRTVDLIAAKRDGEELTAEEIERLVTGYVAGDVGDGQMAAFLMAGMLRGFSDEEAVAFTDVMVASGETLDLSALDGPTIDKHSTGGVADATTLLVAPLLAAAGAAVVKLSGRGLGHTGGTLDKLEAIPGLSVDLGPAETMRVAGSVGCVVAAQTADLVPADRVLYALRDETATVANRALIAASVMSKKIASGAETIVLDVKTGDGAFMRDPDDARALAELCVSLGTTRRRRTLALVTDMSQPLGTAVGNALEIVEVVELLGRPPAGRLAEVALAIATLGLDAARGLDSGRDAPSGSHDELVAAWSDGSALETLGRMIEAQGGDPRVVEDPVGVLPAAPVTREAVATRGGVCTAVPARRTGELAALLGAGRARKEDDVDPAVGIVLDVEVGAEVTPGERLATVHARDEEAAGRVVEELTALIRVGEGAEAPEPVLETVRGG